MLIDTDEYVDASTAAKMLGLTTATVSMQVKAGRFPGHIKVGSTRLIPRVAVENYTRLKPGPKKGGEKA